MKIWKSSKKDAILFLLSILNVIINITLAFNWNELSIYSWIVNVTIVSLITTYNIIVISHFFTHNPWFVSSIMNNFVSMLNSINIGQSIQAYHLTHVRNHHKYHNDNGDPIKDLSSTFLNGKENEHNTLWRYAIIGGIGTLLNIIPHILWSLFSWGHKLSKYDSHFKNLISKDKLNNRKEINQLRLDRLAIFIGLLFLFSVSWKWALLCYLPSILFSFILVNIQNYYEHYGANPENKFSNSVSYYGILYNLLTFNDGYHQEHHISGGTHWSQLPKLRERYYDKFKEQDRIISPVPAILGFLHIKRKLLHKNDKNKE
ncbi:fatty acid desaturase family protein [Xenorhabdus anantnagensis]|uniref:Fatty acid desaturase n=1 Tax=Xenorhabdus anantnagensis TaxID=3025875 RepID=A0ABT5LQE2_9GAMM|nr:fatty acid desaturase [Xenorhabdus anantnagensis]MDC9595309.1 fatty acid desaturase [Xenorhabdus anantnagensis]